MEERTSRGFEATRGGKKRLGLDQRGEKNKAKGVLKFDNQIRAGGTLVLYAKQCNIPTCVN